LIGVVQAIRDPFADTASSHKIKHAVEGETVPAVESQMLPLGTKAPGFSLPDPDGKIHTLEDGAAAYLVMFICNHCPFVKHIREELARLGVDCGERDVAVFAINSNDASMYPGDSPDNMRREAVEWGYSFPYLVDADQSTAKAYRAACTPDFYLFDASQKLVYRGQLDASRPGNGVATDGRDIRAAIDATLAGAPIGEDQVPSIGCSIKWTPGNTPDYF
jgi:hypothetical protein